MGAPDDAATAYPVGASALARGIGTFQNARIHIGQERHVRQMRIVVVGAGIIGLSTAWTLVEAGHEVLLVERAPGPAAGASGRNGAQLSYAFVSPLASPGTLAALPRLLLDPGSPLRFRPGLSPALWQWCWQFLRACTPAQVESTTRALLALAGLSRERFAHWRAGVADEAIEFRRTGKLVLYHGDEAWRAAQRQFALQQAWGPAQQLCSAEECRAHEPALRDDATLRGGVFTPGEEVADCERVCALLLQRLQQQPGFAARWRTEAVGWETGAGDRLQALRVHGPAGEHERLAADAFVVAGGSRAPALLRPVGVKLPVLPLKGYSLELPASALPAMPRVSVTDSRAKTVFAPLGEGEAARLRVAGVAELVGQDLRIDERRIDQLLRSAAQRFGLRSRPADLKPWAGLRPATPTGLPCIGAAGGLRNLYLNTGQGALGFTLAFGSAAQLAACMSGQASPLPAAWAEAFDPLRA
jgi:D-amino-acid dehydrogenase